MHAFFPNLTQMTADMFFRQVNYIHKLTAVAIAYTL